MRSIFARINFDRKPVDQELFSNSLKSLSVHAKNKSAIITRDSAVFGQILFPPDLNENINLAEKNLILVSDSVLYNKTELIKDLNIKKDRISDDEIILTAYKTWGNKCLDHLIGDFAFAIFNTDTQELFCARDQLGIKPFNYYFDNNILVLSSDITGILEQSDLNFSIDEQYIADSISIIKSEKQKTTYNEIKKLPPAHSLIIKKGKLEVKRYWELFPQKIIKNKRDLEVIDRFKGLLIESVKCRSQNQVNTGTELSGGIDSSSITAIASKFSNLTTFSHILPDSMLGKVHPFNDERKFIHLLADHCSISNRCLITSETSLIDAIEQHVNNFKSIAQQNFGVFSDHLYKKAQEQNISILLSGFGGDEVVTSKASGYLYELARNMEWNDLKTDLRNQNPDRLKYYLKSFKHKLKFRFYKIHRFFRYLKFQKPWWKHKFKNLAIHPSFEKSLSIKKQYFDYYNGIKPESLQHRFIDRISHPHVSQRLEYCSLIARRYGIEYRYPLLDIRLIEYYLSVPTRLKARNGIGRYIIRRAMEGILPEKIQWRNDKSGATIPTVFMRMINDKKRINELILEAKTNSVINRFIDLGKYEKWFKKLCNKNKKSGKFINQGAFYNYLKLIIFIKNNPTCFNEKI